MNNGADRTFNEMKDIYKNNGGKVFEIEPFAPEKNEIGYTFISQESKRDVFTDIFCNLDF